MKHKSNNISRIIAISVVAVISLFECTEACAKRYLVEVMRPDGSFLTMSISNHAANKITSKARSRSMLMRYWREKTDKTLILISKFPLHEAPRDTPRLTRANTDSYSLTREQLASCMATMAKKSKKEVRI